MNLNAHYLRETDADALVELIRPRLEKALGSALDEGRIARLTRAMPGLKPRANSLVALAESAAFYVRERPVPIDAKARKFLGGDARPSLEALAETLGAIVPWDESAIEQAVRGLAQQRDVKLGAIAQPLRASLTGSTVSPGIFEVAAILGRDETLDRLRDALQIPEPNPDSPEI